MYNAGLVYSERRARTHTHRRGETNTRGAAQKTTSWRGPLTVGARCEDAEEEREDPAHLRPLVLPGRKLRSGLRSKSEGPTGPGRERRGGSEGGGAEMTLRRLARLPRAARTRLSIPEAAAPARARSIADASATSLARHPLGAPSRPGAGGAILNGGESRRRKG